MNHSTDVSAKGRISWCIIGLVQRHISAHITEYQAPLHPNIMRYIQQYIFEAEYGCSPELEQYAHDVGLTEVEWQTWLELSNSQAANYILAQEDYYCVRFATLATGRVVK